MMPKAQTSLFVLNWRLTRTSGASHFKGSFVSLLCILKIHQDVMIHILVIYSLIIALFTIMFLKMLGKTKIRNAQVDCLFSFHASIILAFHGILHGFEQTISCSKITMNHMFSGQILHTSSCKQGKHHRLGNCKRDFNGQKTYLPDYKWCHLFAPLYR